MAKALEVFKGFLIGIANIIPGVSGGTIACITGIYDMLVYNIGNFFSHPLKALKSLIFILLGMVLGLVSGYFLIGKFLLPLLPLEMAFLFGGLILGGLKPIIKEAKEEKNNFLSIFLFVFSFLILIVLAVIKVSFNRNNNVLDFNFFNCVILFILGILGATAMVVPGVSGSIILLALGYYEPVIELISTVFKEIFSLNFTGNLLMLLLFGIGIILGLVFVSKLISNLIKKYHGYTYKAILGLVMGSIISVLIIGFGSVTFNLSLLIHLGVSLILGVVGTYLGHLMTKMYAIKANDIDEVCEDEV